MPATSYFHGLPRSGPFVEEALRKLKNFIGGDPDFDILVLSFAFLQDFLLVLIQSVIDHEFQLSEDEIVPQRVDGAHLDQLLALEVLEDKLRE